MDDSTRDESTDAEATAARTDDAELVVDGDDELLVEEVSIDGMCGVY